MHTVNFCNWIYIKAFFPHIFSTECGGCYIWANIRSISYLTSKEKLRTAHRGYEWAYVIVYQKRFPLRVTSDFLAPQLRLSSTKLTLFGGKSDFSFCKRTRNKNVCKTGKRARVVFCLFLFFPLQDIKYIITLEDKLTCEIQSERNEAVITSQELQRFLPPHQSSKIICNRFTIEEVVDTNQEVPGAEKKALVIVCNKL